MWLFFSYLWFTMQLIVCEGALILGEKRRKFFWLRFISAFALCVPLAYGLSLLPRQNLLTVLYFILMFVATMGVYAFSFHMNVKDILFFCTGGYAIQHLVFNLITIVTFFTGWPSTVTVGGIIATWLGIHSMVYIAVAVACYFLFMRRLRKNNLFDKKPFGVTVFSIVILFTTIFMSELTGYRYQGAALNRFTSTVVCGLYAVLCCTVVFITQIVVLNMNKAIRDREIQKHIVKLTREQYTISADLFSEINVKFHDIKHQLLSFEMMDGEKRKAAIDGIMKSIEGFSCLVKTENPSLNVVLTEKSLLCRQSRINFNCVINAKLGFLEELDLYTLFGNALDNAIQSASKEEGERRSIDLYINKEKGMTFVNLYNYYSGEIKFSGGLPVTRGNKLYHGFGTRSITETVKKYGGQCLMATENEKFRLSISFPRI